MASSICKARAWGVAAAACVSVSAALLLVFKVVTPEAIGGLRTVEMLGLLALLVMPMSAAWVIRAARASTPARVEPRPIFRVVGDDQPVPLRKAA